MAEGSGTRFLRRRAMTIFFGLGILGVFGSFDEWARDRDDRAFNQRGKPVQSLPETHLPASTTVNDDVALSYVGPDDRVVTAKPIHLDQARLDQVRAGGRIDIIYLPDKPATVRLSDWEPRLPIPLWSGPVVGLLGVVGFVVLWRGRR